MIIWQTLINALAGVLVFWGGFTLGKRNRKSQPPNMCSCQHAFGYHRNKKDCNQYVKVHGYVKTCPCQHYDGQLPAEEYLKSVDL